MGKVGGEVRRLREAKGWTQAKLAVEAGMAISAVSQVENGKRNPGATSLEKLAGALETEVADLFPKAEAPLTLQLEEPMGLSDGWVETYTDVGRELLRGWEKQDRSWDRILQVFVNSLPEERRAKAKFPMILIGKYSDWTLDTGAVIITYVEGVLGKHVAGLEPNLDQVCDQMIRLLGRISAHSGALLHSAVGKDDPDVEKFREQLDAQGALCLEERYYEAISTRESR